LKSALAGLEIYERTGDPSALETYELALRLALASHAEFPESETPRERVMDRLHAYLYFLEGLLPAASRPEVAAALTAGLRRAAALLREIRPSFERSDVCAQLLRLRLHAAPVAPLDRIQAAEEAAWAASHQLASGDPRLHGAFNFGRKHGAALPFANPVSTAFCVQALAGWHDYLHSGRTCDWHELI
jgi:AcrR family transcriptional regulator